MQRNLAFAHVANILPHGCKILRLPSMQAMLKLCVQGAEAELVDSA